MANNIKQNSEYNILKILNLLHNITNIWALRGFSFQNYSNNSITIINRQLQIYSYLLLLILTVAYGWTIWIGVTRNYHLILNLFDLGATTAIYITIFIIIYVLNHKKIQNISNMLHQINIIDRQLLQFDKKLLKFKRKSEFYIILFHLIFFSQFIYFFIIYIKYTGFKNTKYYIFDNILKYFLGIYGLQMVIYLSLLWDRFNYINVILPKIIWFHLRFVNEIRNYHAENSFHSFTGKVSHVIP